MAEEVEAIAVSGNNQRTFQVMRGTVSRRTSVSEMICDGNKEPIHERQHRLDRWAECFREQFS